MIKQESEQSFNNPSTFVYFFFLLFHSFGFFSSVKLQTFLFSATLNIDPESNVDLGHWLKALKFEQGTDYGGLELKP